jgi:hypothetical protein
MKEFKVHYIKNTYIRYTGICMKSPDNGIAMIHCVQRFKGHSCECEQSLPSTVQYITYV